MADSGDTNKRTQQFLLDKETRAKIPLRATRQLPAPRERTQEDQEKTTETALALVPSYSSPPYLAQPEVAPKKQRSPQLRVENIVSPRQAPTPFHRAPRLKLWLVCLIGVVCFLAVTLSAGIFQRPFLTIISNGGESAYDSPGSWQQDHPMDPQHPIVPQSGPYVVLGKASITVDFINQVLSTYNSPAAGKGQSLYDLGIRYGIDPAFALAFFMHESSFGTKGEATKSLSLGNLRCIPNVRCEDNYAQFNSWEDGFNAWYELIRNWYVAVKGLITIDQIIPIYAPPSDNNNDDAYIGALKHAIDTWHAGQIVVG